MIDLQKEINEWRDEHWDEVLADIAALVKIESVEDLASARAGAPFGAGPREALDRALAIAQRYGLVTHDCEGYIGFADLQGASDEQIGIIGHVDVVPAGPGWNVEPYALTRRGGYLLGRGVIDDKGPLMVALHAVRFWRERMEERNESLSKTVRVLFGVNEETNMKDIEYYRTHYSDPAFLFTPDSQFPLGYGEAGICSGTLKSAPIADGEIFELAGGQAVNAVAGEAHAVVRGEGGEGAEAVEYAEGAEAAGESTRCFNARGTSAHAIDFETGESAIGLLVSDLLEANVGNREERAFLELLRDLHRDPSGAVFNIACSDGHFGALSMVGGLISLERDGDTTRICQSLDFRYPTTITAKEIEQRVSEAAARMGATFTMEHNKAPFLMDPNSAEVTALLDAYRAVTGEDAQGSTSKGGTYARCFTRGVSFGPEKPWLETPAWAGGMHGPDEAVSEHLLKEAFTIYALALGNLLRGAVSQ